MRALYFDGISLKFQATYPSPAVKRGEAIIRVLKAGICHTDLEIIKGYMGFRGVPGHEFVGIVEEAPSEFWPGKRVAGEINLPCGQCSFCQTGQARHCPHRQVLGIKDKDGVFADYVTLPEENLHLIPESLSDEEAVFIEPLAAALRVLEQLMSLVGANKNTWRLCVLGDGKLGLLVAQVLKANFPEVVCQGKHPVNLAILASRGIKTYLVGEKIDERFDVVVEATGRKEGFSQAISLVLPEGIVFLKSTIQSDYSYNLSPVVVDEIKIWGSRCGPFDQAIDWLVKKRVDVLELIEAEYDLEDVEKALTRASQPGALKVIFNISSLPGRKAEKNSDK
jgi:threonine dehydrogenase-like Zn-dependent dehydrogenase